MSYLVKFAIGIVEHNFLYYSLLCFILFLIQFFLVKKHIYSIFDPLFFFIGFNSFAWSTAFFSSEWNVFPILDISVMNLAFLLPALFIKPISMNSYHQALLLRLRAIDFQIFYTITIIMVLATLILWLFRGIPVLSDNPDQSKIMLYSGGFGIVRFIHMTTPVFCCLFSLLSLILNDNSTVKKMFLWFIIIISSFILVSTGSKSSILPLVFIFGFVSCLAPYNKKAKRMKTATYWLLLFTIIVVFIVFSLISKSTSFNVIFELFLIRMIAFGDAFYFWYHFHLESKMVQINLIYYLFEPLLSMLKLVQHPFPLGAELVSVATGDDLVSFGPNGQLPIVLALSIGYAKYFIIFLFGCCLFWLRSNLHRIVSKFGIFGMLLFSSSFFLLTNIYADISLLLSTIYAVIIIYFPLYVFLSLFKKKVEK
ncbi:hypothetical protein HC723_15435 [Vibrio sp. S11_S32]|uniref:hypothetical protein n=1 Tax=Vibrio sp. S11_S32 TaxID=2720225 RepID=UPI0016813508|nr:hypothetical protein [Vibrio sp. S11_S32]MBD1577791.1 hypothetical protein [Vibrio sp. S11_S32]